jgi:hypothetical protein
MGGAIGLILGNAVGVAISPVPIISLILMLFSGAAARNSLAFMTGWLIGLVGAGSIVLAIGVDASDGGEADTGGIAKIVIGALFLVLGVKQWRSRPRAGEEPQMPGWMEAIDSFSAGKALGMGVLLSAINPKNLGLTIAATASISGAGLTGGEEFVVLIVFVVIASTTIILPVVGFLAARERVTPALDELKDWLTQNNNAVMAVLFTVLGAKVLGDGLAIVG